jgi:DNA-binding NarL/FixJ family response regulator
MNILILDDHEAIRLVIKQQVLEIIPTANFFEYSTVRGALEHFSERLPVDFVVSDLELTEGCNLSFIATSRTNIKPVLIFSSHVNKVLIQKLEKEEIACYVSKTSGVDALKRGLQALLHGESYYCPLVNQTKLSPDSFKETDPLTLTVGQIKVLREIQKGYNRKETAQRLKVTATTVANQIAKARDINNCDSQEELMRRFRFWEV